MRILATIVSGIGALLVMRAVLAPCPADEMIREVNDMMAGGEPDLPRANVREVVTLLPAWVEGE